MSVSHFPSNAPLSEAAFKAKLKLKLTLTHNLFTTNTKPSHNVYHRPNSTSIEFYRYLYTHEICHNFKSTIVFPLWWNVKRWRDTFDMGHYFMFWFFSTLNRVTERNERRVQEKKAKTYTISIMDSKSLIFAQQSTIQEIDSHFNEMQRLTNSIELIV